MLARDPYYPSVPAVLREIFQVEGLELLGVSDADPDPAAEKRYRSWIESGRHGEMAYLVKHARLKYRPAEILPGCRSILSVGMNYYQRADWGPGRGIATPGDAPAQRGSGTAEPSATIAVAVTPTPAPPTARSATRNAASVPGGGPAPEDARTRDQARDLPAGPTGRIARYAWGRDYHRALGKRLSRITKELRRRYPHDSFRPFTDATPLAERNYGESAGIGFAGRNTLLISGQYGSWFFLGEILSTHAFPQISAAPAGDAGRSAPVADVTRGGPSTGGPSTGRPSTGGPSTGGPSTGRRVDSGRHGACPTSCRRCIDVCPTGALEGPYRIDARRCISYLTIELAGSIPEELREQVGDWLFGCDLCQEVCPLNVRAQVTRVSDFSSWRAGSRLELRDLLRMRTRDQFVRRFAGTPLMRPGRAGLIRNACVVAGNLNDPALLPDLRHLLDDEDAVIREHALWAITRIGR